MYDKNDPNFHDYKISAGTPSLACRIGEGRCSVASVALIVDQEAVPFKYNPGVGNHDILGKNPIVHYSPTDTVSINETRFGHWYHPGRVVHVTFEHNGGVYVFTRGAGIGRNPGWNRAIGGFLFGKMHADVMNRTQREIVRQ